MENINVTGSNQLTLVSVILYVLAVFTMKEWATIAALAAAATTFAVNVVKLWPVAVMWFKKLKNKK
jgi:hypothetical protein